MLHQLRTIDYKLWLVLILSSFVPLIYSTTRIHFIGDLPDSWAFSIAAQVAWLNVGYEVLSEALLIPLAFIFGQVISNIKLLSQRIRGALAVILLSYAIVTVFVLAFAPQMVIAMKQDIALQVKTVEYIRLESVAIFISGIYVFCNLLFLLKNRQRILYGLLAMQAVLTILCDTFFVSQFTFSLQMGIVGIAFSNIIVNFLLVITSVVCIRHIGLLSSCEQKVSGNYEWLKEWFRIGWKSGLESLVRNTAFIVMILQLVNQVQQAGTYWIANQFIWGWLLFPVLALGQLVKRDAATSGGLSCQRVNSYLMLTFGIVFIWLLSAPYWSEFIHSVMGIQDPDAVVQLVWLMTGFYIVFALNNVIDSYFYGTGRTDLMLYQSLIVNSVFYGSAFVLYRIGVFIPTLDRIAIMFGIGIALDAVITWVLYLVVRSRSPAISDICLEGR